MPGSILGTRVVRVEDRRFMTTGGVYTDDLRTVEALRGAATAVFVRSTVAHGTIAAIVSDDAQQMPGVLGVFTAANLALVPDPSPWNKNVARTLLAGDRARYVGEPIAVVVAECAAQAADAAESVYVEFDVLETLVDPEAALTSSTMLYDSVAGNVVVDSVGYGMADVGGDEFFASCDVVVPARFVNQRVAPCPMETRASAAAWVDGRLHQWVSSQHAQRARTRIAAVNGVDEADVRIVAPDVGGGFGAKITVYQEEALLGRIAKEVGRPVRWCETRSESMMALGHGRAQIQYVTIGGTRDGRVTHYRLDAVQDCGAFADIASVLPPFMTRPMASGVYDIANIECRTRSVLTNTTPVVAYRGAGRPEATAAVERAMDLLAAELGLDPVDIRRTNLIAPFDQPHTTAIGQTYDVGDYVGALDRALAVADYDELRAEQRDRRQRGDTVQLGIGVSAYVEITGGVAPFGEDARIDITEAGHAVVFTGSSPHGQGHETAWSMIASARTGIPMEHVTVIWGDTDLVPLGQGTAGSRSLQQAGAAVDKAATELVEIAKSLAAGELEADAADVVLDVDRGVFHVVGTPAVSTGWAEVAARSAPAAAASSASSLASTGSSTAASLISRVVSGSSSST